MAINQAEAFGFQKLAKQWEQILASFETNETDVPAEGADSNRISDCPVCRQPVVLDDFEGDAVAFCCHCGFEGSKEDFK